MFDDIMVGSENRLVNTRLQWIHMVHVQQLCYGTDIYSNLFR